MTYSFTSNTSSLIQFISTSATVQAVDFAGLTTGSVTFNATSGGSWNYTGSHTTVGGASVTLTKGTLNVNGQTVSWGNFAYNNNNTRSLTLGAANITLTGSTTNAWNGSGSTSGLTLSAASATITLTGTNATFASVTTGSKTYGTVIFSGAGAAAISSGGGTFATLTRTGTTTKTDTFTLPAGVTIVVTGTLNLNGNSITNRILVQSSTLGTAATITNTGATMTWTNVDFQDTTLGTSFDASAISGLSGDCGGNTNITFTTTAAQTYTGGTASWSTSGNWTSRVPLPQDNVLLSGVTGGTITADMPRLGKSIDWTNAAGTPAFAVSSTLTVYGSMTLIAAMTYTGTGTMIFGGRGSFTLTSNGKQYPNFVTITAIGGTYTLVDALSTVSDFTLTNGTFNAVTFNVTATNFVISGSLTRSLTMGSGIWSSSSTAGTTIWSLATTTGLTFSGASATIKVTGNSASTRTFAGGGLTYGTLDYTLSGSTGALNITGANTFDTVNFSDISNARSLQFTAATTTTVNTTFNVRGTSGKLVSLNSITAATHTLSKAAGTVAADYLILTNSIATGGAAWYGGSHSTDNGGNTGWIFNDPPGGSGGGMGFPVALSSLLLN